MAGAKEKLVKATVVMARASNGRFISTKGKDQGSRHRCALTVGGRL